MVRWRWVWVSVLACLLPSQPGGAQASLPRESCTRAHVEDYHFVPCLRGEAGTLSDAERVALLAQVRARASTHYDRIRAELTWGALVSDPVARHAVGELLVAHGMPPGALALLDALVDPPARLERSLRRRRSPDVRALRITDCRVVPEASTDLAVQVVCDRFVRCGPSECTATHATASLWIEARGLRLEDARLRRRPSDGSCGDCL